ncbi:MAG: putative peptidoglycan glycosyltransferase FtsW [Chthoniobacteraceae bacterium]
MQKRFVFINVFLLVIAVAALVSLGIVMLTSTGAYAQDNRGDPNYYLTHQFMWLGVGTVLCIIAALLDYRLLEKNWWLLYGAAVVLLCCCFIPGIGKSIHGSRRWIGFAGQTLQPSEIAKLAALVGLAWWFSRKQTAARGFLDGFVYPLLGIGALVALIVPEVDLGSSVLITGAGLLVMFVAGTRLHYLAFTGALGLGLLALAIWLLPERTGRFLAFIKPEQYHADAYQQVQGLIAIGSGGVGGLGLGSGRQKSAYLPFAHTDFIFPVVGEELGLFFALAVVFCYLVVLVTGIVIATRASDRFGQLLGFGIVALIALQAAMNIGVTTMVLPNKGLPLPFISYGGSNLAFCLAGIGILISIYRRGFGETPDPDGHRFQARIKKRRTTRL